MKRLLIFWALGFGAWVFAGAGTAFADVSPVDGYAWSSNLGWVSFSCRGSNNCGISNYSVNLDRSTGALSGYAWNSAVGWISFQASDVFGCPLAPCPPVLNGNRLSGWAKVLSGSEAQGAPGWIHLSGGNYGVNFDGIKFKGFSWNNDVLGWLEWNPAEGPGVYSAAERKLNTGLSGDGNNSSVSAESDVCQQASCVFSFEDGTFVNLMANAGSGFAFDHWSGANAGDCPTLTSPVCSGLAMTADKEISAVFKVDQNPPPPPVCNNNYSYCLDNNGNLVQNPSCSSSQQVLTVAIVAAPGAAGKVVSAPAGIACEPNCTKEYNNNQSVTLTALPANNRSVFQNWTGACSGNDPSCTVSMNASRSVTAHFGYSILPPPPPPPKPGSANCPADGPGKCPQCNDGVDNDHDGTCDWNGCVIGGQKYPPDPSCQGDPNKNREGGPINIIEI